MRKRYALSALFAVFFLVISAYAFADEATDSTTKTILQSVGKYVDSEADKRAAKNNPMTPLDRLDTAIKLVKYWLGQNSQYNSVYQSILKELQDQRDKLQDKVNAGAEILAKYQCELVVKQPKDANGQEPPLKTIKIDADAFRGNAGMQVVELDGGAIQMVPSVPKGTKANLRVFFFYSDKDDGHRMVIGADGGEEISDSKEAGGKEGSDQKRIIPLVAQVKAQSLTDVSLQLFGQRNEYHINCK
jgi:hypothetical protein